MCSSEQTASWSAITLWYQNGSGIGFVPHSIYRELQGNLMTIAMPVRGINYLIESLPRRERKRILKYSEPVELVFGAVLCQPTQPICYVYFPLNGFISLMVTVGGRQQLEMSLIGNEGMLGATLILGVNTAAMHGVVQGAGHALRMTTAQLRRELRESPVLRRRLGRYLYALMAQVSQSAACTHFHTVQPRLACCLLMVHDRVQTDHFYLTHEFLASMLGVRRSSITLAAGVLQQQKLIRYSRGEILILNRKGLEAASCACYAVMSEKTWITNHRFFRYMA